MLRRFLSPRGRRSRLTYWRAVALVPLLGMLGLVVALIALRIVLTIGFQTGVSSTAYATLVVFLLMLWAWLAIAIQRLHDRDASGWWVLIALVPVIGFLWYLLWNGLRPGTPGPNRFGPDPRAGDAALIEVFGDGPVPRRARKPILSTLVAWAILLAIMAVNILLFQGPVRRPPPATSTQPIER